MKSILVKCNLFDKLKKESELGTLSTRSRRQLIYGFVEHTIQNVIWISQHEFLDVFEKVQSLFKFEKIEKYYNEKTKGDGNAYPGGQLFYHYKYRHDILKKEQGIRKNRKLKKPEKKCEYACTLTPLEAERIRRDLIGRQEPWERILSDWEKTAPNRRNDMLTLEVAGTVPRWPKYKKKQAVQLVSTFHNPSQYPDINFEFGTHFFLILLRRNDRKRKKH